uniref:Putative mitochondrial protein n=1 Tax=Tanacetum cinerariifolium TaxID=118510 RepID=A0A6L2JRJ0_TANCI|nr:putative mitochondrial protein [Tanacetum cinerariifolium]
MGRKMVQRGTRNTTIHWMQGKEASKGRQIKQAELASMVLCVYPVTLWQMKGNQVFDKEVDKVLVKFERVFELPNELPPQKAHDHQIPLMPNTPPINVRPYKHHPNKKDAIELMMKELLESRVIRTSQSPFSSPIVMVKKKDLKELFKPFFGKFVLVFFDDILIYSKSKEEHGVSMDLSKIKVMQKWPTSTTIKRLRGFLGLIGYEVELAYNELKKAVMEEPVLALPNFNQEFVVETDTSGTRIGAVLSVYCQTPPIHIPYVLGESKVEGVDKTLRTREEVVQMLKFYLKRPTSNEIIASAGREWYSSTQAYGHFGKRLGKLNMYVLTQWTNKPTEEATWEVYGDLIPRFPELDKLP